MAERLWSKVNKNGPVPAHRPELGPCWVWTGTKNTNGYGVIDDRNGETGKVFAAHKVAYTVAVGPIAEGHRVLHHCDNPPCCRPDHLFTGTHTDNMRDMGQKGRDGRVLHPERYPVGAAVKNAKLTEGEIREIRSRWTAGGETTYTLAAAYGISQASVHRIIQRQSWAHVT